MATNPPVTIGPFTNVPAPGSGIKSDWPQQISQYVVDHATELLYAQITASVNVPTTANTDAAGVTVINPGNVTYPAKPIIIEFFAVGVTAPPSAQVLLNLWDSNTDLGRIAQFINPNTTGPGSLLTPVLVRRRLTPTAGAHNYNIRAWCVATAAGTVSAGPGGTATYQPAYLRITGA